MADETTGTRLVLDLTRFPEDALLKATAIVNAGARAMLGPRPTATGDLLLCLSAELDEARMARERALDAMRRDLAADDDQVHDVDEG